MRTREHVFIKLIVFLDSVSSIPITVVHTAHMSARRLLVPGRCTSCEWYPITQMSRLNMMPGFFWATGWRLWLACRAGLRGRVGTENNRPVILLKKITDLLYQWQYTDSTVLTKSIYSLEGCNWKNVFTLSWISTKKIPYYIGKYVVN